MSGWESVLPFVLIVAVFWLLVVRPSRNQQKRLRETQSSLDVGTEVMLGSGLYGTVTELGDETLQLDLGPGTNVKVARQAVVKLVEHSVQDPEPGAEPVTEERSADPSAESQD